MISFFPPPGFLWPSVLSCWDYRKVVSEYKDRLLLSSSISANMKCKTREKAKVDLRSLCGSSGSLWTKRPPHRICSGFWALLRNLPLRILQRENFVPRKRQGMAITLRRLCFILGAFALIVSQVGGQTMQHAGQLSSAQFSPDSRWVVTTSKDYTARLWDANTGQAVASL